MLISIEIFDRKMNTDLLRTFIEIAKTRHFGNAAENLYLTQSAISSRIKQLEEIIGTELFTRQRKNILLTSAGERLLPHAENILATWQLALQDVGVSESKNIQLAIGGTSNLWDTFLQSLLPKIADLYPRFFFRTEINSPQEISRALLAGRLDIGVSFDPPSVSDIHHSKIGSVELVLVSSKKIHDIEEIVDIGYIFVDWGTAFNLQFAKLFAEPIAPKLHTSQTHIALEFMLSKGGAGFLPKPLVEPLLVESHLHIVKGTESVKREVFATYSIGSDRIDAVRKVVNSLQEFELKPIDPIQ